MAPTMPAAAAAAAQLSSQLSAPTANQQPQNPQLTAATTNPYPGYNLTSVDMSSFNGIDWSSMYGMYV